jgi:hypothetical protein
MPTRAAAARRLLRRDPAPQQRRRARAGRRRGRHRCAFDAGDERWGTDVKTARDCVAKLYNLDTQPLAAAGHADVLVDWLQGLDAAIQTRVEGESGGGAAS